MWLLLARGRSAGNGVEDVLARLAALESFAADLRGRVAAVGLGDIEELVARARLIGAVLDGIPGAELERVRADAAALRRSLEEVAGAIGAIARIRRTVAG